MSNEPDPNPPARELGGELRALEGELTRLMEPGGPLVGERAEGVQELDGAAAAELAGPAASSGGAAVARALDRLRRDLIPRTAGGDKSLVVGIVGPNNAGKSALFNALTESKSSPSLATGGATRRLVGAARPELAERLRAAREWTRFVLIDWDPTRPEQAKLPLDNAVDPAELLLVTAESVPAGVLLIDTPDFDSIAHENRFASEALLAVADVAIVVVTRHSYQNAEVVDYLRRWLASGRPWILVYNEAPSLDLAIEHARKLALDVESEPFAVYQSPYERDVMEGRAPLVPKRVGDGGRSLGEELAELGGRGELKRAALEAGLGQLETDLAAVRDAVERRSGRAREVLSRAELIAADTGRRIAARAMPIGPFLEAFRSVLDERSNAWSRRWRSGVRAARTRIESVPRLLFGESKSKSDPASRGGLTAVERAEVERAWPDFFEEVARDLGPEARHTSRRDASEAIASVLDADLVNEADSGLERARTLLLDLPTEFDDFERACETLVARSLEERGFDWDLRVLADAATLLPVGVAGALVLTTGGLGADVAAVGTGTLTTGLLERFTPTLLGSQTARAARRSWEESRGAEIAQVLLDASLPHARKTLTTASRGGHEAAQRLTEFEQRIAVARREPAPELQGE